MYLPDGFKRACTKNKGNPLNGTITTLQNAVLVACIPEEFLLVNKKPLTEEQRKAIFAGGFGGGGRGGRSGPGGDKNKPTHPEYDPFGGYQAPDLPDLSHYDQGWGISEGSRVPDYVKPGVLPSLPPLAENQLKTTPNTGSVKVKPGGGSKGGGGGGSKGGGSGQQKPNMPEEPAPDINFDDWLNGTGTSPAVPPRGGQPPLTGGPAPYPGPITTGPAIGQPPRDNGPLPPGRGGQPPPYTGGPAPVPGHGISQPPVVQPRDRTPPVDTGDLPTTGRQPPYTGGPAPVPGYGQPTPSNPGAGGGGGGNPPPNNARGGFPKQPPEGTRVTDPVTGRQFTVGQMMVQEVMTTEAYRRAIEAYSGGGDNGSDQTAPSVPGSGAGPALAGDTSGTGRAGTGGTTNVAIGPDGSSMVTVGMSGGVVAEPVEYPRIVDPAGGGMRDASDPGPVGVGYGRSTPGVVGVSPQVPQDGMPVDAQLSGMSNQIATNPQTGTTPAGTSAGAGDEGVIATQGFNDQSSGDPQKDGDLRPPKGGLKEFPEEWGEPPPRQTRDMVDLPTGGQGSSTLRNWIQSKIEEFGMPESFSGSTAAPSPAGFVDARGLKMSAPDENGVMTGSHADLIAYMKARGTAGIKAPPVEYNGQRGIMMGGNFYAYSTQESGDPQPKTKTEKTRDTLRTLR